MVELEYDLWDVLADVHCITTNGTVTAAGTNVMGGGCAWEASQRYPYAPRRLGELLKTHGNRVYLLGPRLVSFPTKEDVRMPSTLGRISQSVKELVKLTDLYDWRKVALPRPGCGLGGLSWADVRPVLAHLDDRFLIVDFPKEKRDPNAPGEGFRRGGYGG